MVSCGGGLMEGVKQVSVMGGGKDDDVEVMEGVRVLGIREMCDGV